MKTLVSLALSNIKVKVIRCLQIKKKKRQEEEGGLSNQWGMIEKSQSFTKGFHSQHVKGFLCISDTHFSLPLA